MTIPLGKIAKEKNRKGNSKCMISNEAQLLSTVKINFLLARTMSELLCQPIGKQIEVVLSAILH